MILGGYKKIMKRESGILLPVFSLPGPYGIGCFSKYARRWIDCLAASGQSYWQILPLGPTGYGDSPYQSFSTFAGNLYFIDLETLCEQGILTRDECAAAFDNNNNNKPDKIDYGKLYQVREPLLRRAFEREREHIEKNSDYQEFIKRNRAWLDDYALFMAIKNYFGNIAWTEWPEEYQTRQPAALNFMRDLLRDDINFREYAQYLFFSQWQDLLNYAHGKNIKIIGDIPIYVAMDSADTWANPELFQFNINNINKNNNINININNNHEFKKLLSPVAVAGCPPDGFAADGQLWGNPLYNWDYHKKTGYDWWMKRLKHCFELYDVLRIDHFRGFDEYYAIPVINGEIPETAAGGHWEPGPGMDLFENIKAKLGDHDVIAEDLGYVTDSVRELVKNTGFPGMKVLQFAFDSRDTGSAADYLPHNYIENCVVYTGTHDNETVMGWLENRPEIEYKAVRDYLCDDYTPDEKLYLPFIAAAMRSRARLCVIPVQDWLGLDNSCRLNRPSTLGTNWTWRTRENQIFSDAFLNQIADFTRRYGREN